MSSEIRTYIDVEEVDQLAWRHGTRAHLDAPKAGAESEGDTLHLAGWVLGTDSRSAVAAEVSAGGNVLLRTPLGLERPDLEEAFSGDVRAPYAGFSTSMRISSMTPMELTVDGVLQDDSRVPVATVRLRRRFRERLDGGGATLVSVVVTVMAAHARVAEAIESVLAQTYPHFELIVVNATGATEVEAEARRYPGVVVTACEGGRAAARNAGLAAATGSAMVFLDASERLLPAALEIGLVELAAQPECAFVTGRCRVTRPYHDDPEYPQQPLVTIGHYAVLLGRNYILTPAVVMFRRPALEAVGPFDETLAAFDDYDLYLRSARDFRIGCHHAVVAESPALEGEIQLLEDRAHARDVDTVLERQRPHVAGNPALELAWRLGQAFWSRRIAAPDGAPTEPPGSRRLGRDPDVGIPPSPGHVQFGDLRRLTPLSTNFGFDRGTPIDRHYIDAFVREHADDIRGKVLEVQENDYTIRFGGDLVEVSDVLSLEVDNPRATLVADLGEPDGLPASAFDCAIVTQVLHLLEQPRDGVLALQRLLKPGGVALVTVPGISQVEWFESWHWSFTILSAQKLFRDVFGPENVRARAHGNVLAATAFLWGLSVEEVDPTELDYVDPSYPVTITVRAVKAQPI